MHKDPINLSWKIICIPNLYGCPSTTLSLSKMNSTIKFYPSSVYTRWHVAFLQVFLFFSFFDRRNRSPPPTEHFFLSLKIFQTFLSTFPACLKNFSNICQISMGSQITTKEVTFLRIFFYGTFARETSWLYWQENSISFCVFLV